MVVVYDHTVQEHHFLSSGTLMASTCDLKGTNIGKTAQCDRLQSWPTPLRNPRIKKLQKEICPGGAKKPERML